MDRSVEIRISTSTDPRRDGRYFIDIRDTTGGRNRQMTTQVMDLEDARVFIDKLRLEAENQGIATTVIDSTRQVMP